MQQLPPIKEEGEFEEEEEQKEKVVEQKEEKEQEAERKEEEQKVDQKEEEDQAEQTEEDMAVKLEKEERTVKCGDSSAKEVYVLREKLKDTERTLEALKNRAKGYVREAKSKIAHLEEQLRIEKERTKNW